MTNSVFAHFLDTPLFFHLLILPDIIKVVPFTQVHKARGIGREPIIRISRNPFWFVGGIHNSQLLFIPEVLVPSLKSIASSSGWATSPCHWELHQPMLAQTPPIPIVQQKNLEESSLSTYHLHISLHNANIPLTPQGKNLNVPPIRAVRSYGKSLSKNQIELNG